MAKTRRLAIIFLTTLLSFIPTSPAITIPIRVNPIYASATVRFLYDGDGARVAKIESGKTTLYVGDLEKNLTTGEVTKYYGLGGKRVAVKENGNLSFLVSDHLGSLRILLAPRSLGEVGSSLSNLGNLNGSSIVKVSYFPYGSIRSQTGTPPSRQYTGQINDEQTGLYFYNARYYNPQIGLFISPDMIATNKIEGSSLNRFAYTKGNPVRFTDNSGRDVVPCTFFGNCDRIKQIIEGGGAASCQEGDLGCQARHKFFSLVYHLPFVGPELAENELTVNEKLNAEAASLIPGPAMMTFKGGLSLTGIYGEIDTSLRGLVKTARRIETRNIIRAKYRLPPQEMLDNDVTGYARRLEEVAQENNLLIRRPYEFQAFLKENPRADGFLYGNNIITTGKTIYGQTKLLEHELIHGLQRIRYPGMTPRMREYEAYMAGASNASFQYSDLISDIADNVSNSLRSYYRLLKRLE